MQKFAKLLRTHVEDVNTLLGEGIADRGKRQSFADFLSRRAIMGAGVPPVVMMHIQLSICRAGNPASADVGISGASGDRCGDITASAFSAPRRTCGSSVDMAPTAKSTRFAITSGIAWSDAVIGHESEVDIAVLRQHFRREVKRRADRRNGDADGLGFLFCDCDDVGNVFGGKGRCRDEQHFRRHNHRYRDEVARVIEAWVGQ